MTRNNDQSKAAGISLREATASDDDFLFALYGSTRRDEMTAWGMPEAQQDSFLRLQYRAQQQRFLAERDRSRHDIILRDGTPVGRMIVVRSADEIRPTTLRSARATSSRQAASAVATSCATAGAGR
jgi:hypothetical protein